MISNIRPQGILAGLLVASAVALSTPAPVAAQGSSASKPSLDYEFFKTQVQPIFLKSGFRTTPAATFATRQAITTAETFSWSGWRTGRSSWTEEQSRANFKVVSRFVTPGNPLTSMFAIMPLAPEVGGIADTHQGGRQFRSGRPGLEDHRGMDPRRTGGRLLLAVAERFNAL